MSRPELIISTPRVKGSSDLQAWRVLTILSASIVLSMTTWFSATAVIPELSREWGLSGSEAAWLTNAVQIGFVVGALGASLLNLPDVMPARTLMTMAAALAALSNEVLLIAPSASTAIVARFLTGVALAGVYPPALKLISTWFVRGRGLALGCVIGALTIGSAFPHLLKAITTTLDWRLVVVATSTMTLIVAILMAMFAEEGPHAGRRAVFDPRQIGVVLLNRPAALANIGYFGHMWELYAMWGWFLSFAIAYKTANPETAISASMIAFIVIASGALGCVLGGILADRLGRTATTAWMMAISGACSIIIGQTFDAPIWIMLAVAIVWGVTVIGDSAQFSAMITEIVDPTLTGTALALQLGLGFALTVFALSAVPAFAAWLGGWQWAFLILAPGPMIGVTAMLALRRRPEAVRIAQGRR
jgi:MFS family permease